VMSLLLGAEDGRGLQVWVMESVFRRTPVEYCVPPLAVTRIGTLPLTRPK
jgi:hypothetical protein